jgi:hypothetical protein
MKIAPYFLALFIVAGIYSSCKKLDQLVSFNLDTKDSTKWIGLIDTVLTDTFPNNNGFILMSEEFAFSDNSKFSTNQTSPSLVESLTALNFTIELKDLRANDLTFCKDLKIFLVSPTNAFPEIELYTVAFPVPSSIIATEEIIGTDSELLQAIKKDKYQFKTQFELVGPAPDSLRLSYETHFRLKANPSE